MSATARRVRLKGRREGGTFGQVPTAVLESRGYSKLGHPARAVLLHFAGRYRGNNNGDLSAPLSAKPAGIASPTTLARALRQLLHYGLLEVTRPGGSPTKGGGGRHEATLYALTWLPIDYCGGKLKVPATKVASGKWKVEPTVPLERPNWEKRRYSRSSGPIPGEYSSGPSEHAAATPEVSNVAAFSRPAGTRGVLLLDYQRALGKHLLARNSWWVAE